MRQGLEASCSWFILIRRSGMFEPQINKLAEQFIFAHCTDPLTNTYKLTTKLIFIQLLTLGNIWLLSKGRKIRKGF